ncbi:MAG: hypothetical protein ACR2O0_13930 [Rhizobiaceae bacterium]
MTGKPFLFAIPAAAMVVAATATPSHAFMSAFVLADKYLKYESKKAYNTPGHAEWCARSKPGFRPQWNNWRTPEGRVTYCSSPYYSLPWKPYNGN